MAFDAFLKLTDIKGESQVKGFEDQIQIESFHWGVAQSGTIGGGGGGGAGIASRQDFLFTAGSSKASPELFIACVTGENIKEGLLTLRSAGQQQATFSTVKLTNVIIAGYDQAGSDDGANPMDEFSLRYGRIEFEYDTVKQGFDFQT
ncbi:MAG TPA: type VI secretion system tube protein Hcp, partial [Gaiellaceae bacterium]|nr:type VI secretion system tube protein Hcp [Gaiellaceae bacterium]